MYIKNIKLSNFRNYEKLNIELGKGVNIITGDNAQGKTNILESIYYSSLAKSHRTNKDKEMIKWDSKDAYISIHVCNEKRLDKKIEIKILNNGKKGIKINSIKLRKISELVGVFNVVMFSPEDLKIIKDAPSNRRRLLDIELCQLSNKYYYNLVQYNKVLSERNKLLKIWNIKKGIKNKSFLNIIEVYDNQLSKFGALIIKDRANYIEKLNSKGNPIHSELTLYNENIKFKYITSVNDIDKAEEQLLEILTRNRKKDLDKKITSIGPHRDDFSVYINEINTRNYGSQGQQRTAILTIKLASLEIIKEKNGEYPVLLLDDVLSELDSKRQKYILKSVKDIQTIITCTDIEDMKDYLDDKSKVYNVKEGIVREMI